MLKCSDIQSMGDSHVDGSLPWRARLSFRLHTLMCVHCRRYIRQLRALLKAFPCVHPPASDADVDAIMNRLRKAQHQNEGKNV